MLRLTMVAGIRIVSLLIVLSLLGNLSWAVTGVLSAVVIGVVGWILNYVSKREEKPSPKAKAKLSKSVEQPTQTRTILEETCEIQGEEYVYYDLDLNSRERVKGEVSSDEAINLYFLTEYGFRKFEKNKDFSYEYGAEGILRKRIQFTPSRTGMWYLVMENEGEDSCTVDIHLSV